MKRASLDDALAELPIVAILRGVRPTEVLAVADALYRAGVRAIEVPLNSPDPFGSIELLAREFSRESVFGAGTVVSVQDVNRLADAGGSIAVSPNTNPAVIRRCLEAGIEPIPGWSSATEAFDAYDAGARRLKLFPAGSYGPGHLRALLAVLPTSITVLAVGGIGVSAVDEWLAAGAEGFGIGSELYRPGDTPSEVFDKAQPIVSAVRRGAAGLEPR